MLYSVYMDRTPFFSHHSPKTDWAILVNSSRNYTCRIGVFKVVTHQRYLPCYYPCGKYESMEAPSCHLEAMTG